MLQAEASKSLSCFVEFMTPDEPPAPHHDWMAEKLEKLMRREIMRAAFSMPPGHAKTKFCSRFFPAFYLGNNPSHRWFQGGHSQQFCENEFGKPTRDIIMDPKYQLVFPGVTVNARSSAAGNWKLDQRRGGYVTKGVGQKTAGYRGHIGCGDDLIGSKEDADSALIREKTFKWLWADFRTRLLPRSPMFMVATRWHPDDPIGRIEQYNKEGKGIPWEIYNLTGLIETEEEAAVDPMGRDVGESLWGDFYDVPTMLELKATLPSRDWWALYKGKPRNEEGNVVKRSWFQRYDDLPERGVTSGNMRALRRITISVDTANKTTERSNHTVATVWFEDMGRRHYLAHVMRAKLEYNAMVAAVERLAADWNASAILIEDKGNGTTFLQNRQGLAPCPLIAIDVKADSKEFRFDGVTPMFEAGTVFFPRMAPWLDAYEEELLAFPTGSEDDQVDSTSQYLSWAGVRKRAGGTKKMKGLGARSGRVHAHA